MRQKTNRADQEKKQIIFGYCYGDRYNPKTTQTEVCKHRDECELYHRYESVLQKRKISEILHIDMEDHVGNQYIKDWRKCEVWKTHKKQ